MPNIVLGGFLKADILMLAMAVCFSGLNDQVMDALNRIDTVTGEKVIRVLLEHPLIQTAQWQATLT